jgi:hypothetical protein
MKSETDGKTEDGRAIGLPIIVDLGKIGRKKAKQLKRGDGIYLEEVVPAVEQVRASLPKADSGKEVVTVVVLYERKVKFPAIFPNLLR